MAYTDRVISQARGVVALEDLPDGRLLEEEVRAATTASAIAGAPRTLAYQSIHWLFRRRG